MIKGIAVAAALCILSAAGLAWAGSAAPSASAGKAALERARLLFYASVEEKKQIRPAIAAFEELAVAQPEWAGRARTYIGALVALQGKHAFLPHDKWRLANRGLEIMDEGVAMAPEDVESLFIHSSTCYFLPFFFKRGEDAQAKFGELVRLLPQNHREFDDAMLANVVQFIAERAHLDESQKADLERLREELHHERSMPAVVRTEEGAGS